MPKVSVCGLLHELVLRDRPDREDGNYGRYDGKEGKIYIDKMMPQNVQDSTLVHEWLHGVYQQYGVDHQEQHVSVIAAELYRCGFRIKVIEDGR